MTNWRNPEEYTYARAINLLGWAWEFLRRNQDYRAAWAAILETAIARHAEPDRRDLVEREKALRSQLADFGLLSFHDPELTAAYNLAPLWLGAVGFGTTRSTRDQPYPRGTWAGFPHTIETTFSFSKPLDAQIEMVARFLKECERRVHELTGSRPETPKIRFNPDRFILYLRLLDAHASGASIGEMARELFGAKADTRNSAKGALRLAQEIVAGRYKELLWKRKPSVEEEGEEEKEGGE